MINPNMRSYDYYLYGEPNEYGQPQLSKEVQGQIKMSIHLTTRNITDNIQYTNATYVGLTSDKDINDTYVIRYNDAMLKVLYVIPAGRKNQIFMGEM